MKLTDERIEEIKAAEKAATPGPWENDPAWNVVEKVGDDVPLMDCLHREDAQLVIILRNTISDLLAEREEREREIERYLWMMKELAEMARAALGIKQTEWPQCPSNKHRLFHKIETALDAAAALREQIEEVREWDEKKRSYKWQPGLLQMAHKQNSDELRAILDKKARE